MYETQPDNRFDQCVVLQKYSQYGASGWWWRDEHCGNYREAFVCERIKTGKFVSLKTYIVGLDFIEGYANGFL